MMTKLIIFLTLVAAALWFWIVIAKMAGAL